MSSVADDDRSYFYHRAQIQMELAERAETGAAVNAHVEMAERYLEMCDAEAILAEARAEHEGYSPWRDEDEA